MIRYIQRKRIDLNKFGTLILESEKTNQFTNKGPAKKQLEKKHTILAQTELSTVVIPVILDQDLGEIAISNH